MIDWLKILNKYHIEYVTSGPSTAKDNAYVKCVWCGAADQGYHLGISLRGRGYGCWRNARHRGKSDSRLLAALLKVTQAKASELLGERTEVVDDDDLAGAVRSMFDEVLKDTLAKVTHVRMPEDVKPLHGKAATRRFMFLEYLEKRRGYDFADCELIAKRYDLHCATRGAFTYRVVFPVRDEGGNLATLTGRSIAPDVELRYLTLSPDPESKLAALQELPVAAGPITDYLFMEPYLFRDPPSALVVCEGPFDAMRVDWAHFSAARDVGATCVFGKSISPAQVDKLAVLADFCDYKFLLLDPDARFTLLATAARLEPFGYKPIYLSERWEDPGDRTLPLGEIRRIIEKEIRRW